MIDKGACRYCFNLQQLTLGDAVQTIGSEAFERCWLLQEVTIPASAVTIGADSFKGCSLLTTVRILNKDTALERHAFGEGEVALTCMDYSGDIRAQLSNAFKGPTPKSTCTGAHADATEATKFSCACVSVLLWPMGISPLPCIYLCQAWSTAPEPGATGAPRYVRLPLLPKAAPAAPGQRKRSP
jgi:hypothetical protein